MYDPEKDFQKMTERIKKICREKGITYNELAKMAGISNSTLSYFLGGKTTPYVYTLLKIFRALNVSPAEVFEDIEEKFEASFQIYHDDALVGSSESGKNENNMVTPALARKLELNKISERCNSFSDEKKALLELFIEVLER